MEINISYQMYVSLSVVGLIQCKYYLKAVSVTMKWWEIFYCDEMCWSWRSINAWRAERLMMKNSMLKYNGRRMWAVLWKTWKSDMKTMQMWWKQERQEGKRRMIWRATTKVSKWKMAIPLRRNKEKHYWKKKEAWRKVSKYQKRRS